MAADCGLGIKQGLSIKRKLRTVLTSGYNCYKLIPADCCEWRVVQIYSHQNKLAYEGALRVPIGVPWICKKCSLLKEKQSTIKQ